MANLTDAKASQTEKSGCGTSLIFILAGFWTVGVIATCQVITWGWEQASFSTNFFKFDPRWMVGLGGSLAVWLPPFFLARSARLVLRPVYRTWRMMAEVALLMTPARLLPLTSSLAVSVWQTFALALYLFFLWLTLVRKDPELRLNQTLIAPNRILIAVGMGILLLLPWMAWGALGSFADVVTGGVVAILSGIAAALAFEGGMFSAESRNRPVREAPWQRFLAAPTSLAILAFGLGLNMNEWLVLLAIPPLGWLVATIAAPTEPPRAGWTAVALILALGISGPLVWFDPDELALVVSSGRGELIDWALTAGITALVIAALWAVIARRLRSLWRQGRIAGRRIPFLFAILSMGLGLAVYIFQGRPGFYGEQLFVVLKDQPDLSSTAGQADPNQRRAAVYQTLAAEAVRSQGGLRQLLDRWGVHYRPYYLVNALEVDGGPLVRLFLQGRPEVDRVLTSPHLRPLPGPLPVSKGDQRAPASPGWNLTTIHANQVWDELGVTGKGVVIGQSDSGVDALHPELAGQYRGRVGHEDLSWLDPWFHSRQPQDYGGHGTHTLGIALGKTVGVAPGAEWIGCVNLARNLGNPALYLDCWQFMLAPYPPGADPFRDGRPEMGANVLNNSWGCPVVEGCDAETFLPAVRALETAGVFVVVSAGNDGDSGCGSLTDPPAIYQDAFTVGAVDSQKQRASFSSLGPVTVDGSERVKPDLMAPGEQVLSAFPGGTYARLSGTSMAGPHVAGTVALIWSANPKLIGEIERTRLILISTAQPYPGRLSGCGGASSPNDTAGYGIVDALAAVQMAIQAK